MQTKNDAITDDARAMFTSIEAMFTNIGTVFTNIGTVFTNTGQYGWHQSNVSRT